MREIFWKKKKIKKESKVKITLFRKKVGMKSTRKEKNTDY